MSPTLRRSHGAGATNLVVEMGSIKEANLAAQIVNRRIQAIANEPRAADNNGTVAGFLAPEAT
jgi:hypothetical protein